MLQRVQYIILAVALLLVVILCAPQFFIGALGTGVSSLDRALQFVANLLPSAISIFLTIVVAGCFGVFLLIHLFINKQTARLLERDSLTGFFSLSKFESCYDLTLHHNKGKRFALILLEVEDYASYYKRQGREKSEHLLKVVAQSIDKLLKKSDLFARKNTYEFVILYSYETDLDITDFLGRINEVIKEVVLVSGYVKITDTQGYFVQLERAQNALELTKRSGGLRVSDFESTLKESNRRYIEENMQKALETGEFSLFLQPKYHLIENRYCGAKALMRWVRPDGTVIYPKEFVKIFEEKGFVIKSDLYMVEQACSKIRRWIDAGEKPVPISLSISRKYFINMTLIRGIVDTIKKYGIPPALIELELTETNVAITVQQLIDISQNFQGVDFVVGAEGGGSQSFLQMIDSMPVSYICLGRNMSLVALDHFKNMSLLKSMVTLLAEKGIQTVADGIETSAHLEAVKLMGCTIAYGFYYSEPITPNKFEHMVFGKVVG